MVLVNFIFYLNASLKNSTEFFASKSICSIVLPFDISRPRSVPGIVYGLQHYSDVDSSMLEWHGHNDFYKAVANASPQIPAGHILP